RGERDSVAARDKLEEQLAELWAKILSVPMVGRHDNFFELGGHSLLAIRLFTAIERSFGRRLPVATLFQAPTLEQLAAVLRQPRKAAVSESSLVELQVGGDRPPVFFFPGGGGSEPEFFIYARLAHHVGPEYPFYGLRAPGTDGITKPHTRVQDIAADGLKEIQ